MIFCEARPFENADDPDVHRVFRGRKSAHLMADSHEELIAYAYKIGLKPRWIQKEGKWDEHFDIVGVVLVRVLNDARVVKLTREDFVKKLQERRNA